MATEPQKVFVAADDDLRARTDSAFQNAIVIRISLHDPQGFRWMHECRDGAGVERSASISSGERPNLSRRMRNVSFRIASETYSSICPSCARSRMVWGFPPKWMALTRILLSATTFTARAVRLGFPERPSQRRPQLLRPSCSHDGVVRHACSSQATDGRHLADRFCRQLIDGLPLRARDFSIALEQVSVGPG